MRLQKLLAERGVASRRACEQIIAEGRVQVNGQTIREMGVQVEEADRVLVDGKPIPEPARLTYLMYHKPAGEVTTAADPEGRPTVLDKFRDFPERLYPVGRLDYDSEGLLLLTNDGALTQSLLHPSREVEKGYLARVSGCLQPDDLRRLRDGVLIGGRRTAPAKARVIFTCELYSDVLLTIHEGRNRQIRRMIEAVGHQVTMLRRVSFGPLKLGDLPRGMWRKLTDTEMRALDAYRLPPPSCDGAATL